ncbi:MAG: hypothetical protein ACXVLT_05335 [Flavisolibacter sp.]
MKRILLMFALAGSLVACNNSADSTAEKKDSLDSMATEKKDMVDSTAEQKKNMIDSTTEKKKDAIERMDSLNKKDSATTKHERKEHEKK